MKTDDDDDLFLKSNGDPLNDPIATMAKKAGAKTQAADHVGCPIGWLAQVLPHLRGASQLAVALLMYRRWVLGGRRKAFDFSNADPNKLGISRQVKAQTLAKLEEAELIAVKQQHGHAPQITRRWK
jgi:hypothetical protein